MKILLDHNVPWPVRKLLMKEGHDVVTARFRGWDRLKNGKLLEAASGEFEVVVTIDKGIEYENMVSRFQITLIVLRPKRAVMRFIEALMEKLRKQLTTVRSGRVYIIE